MLSKKISKKISKATNSKIIIEMFAIYKNEDNTITHQKNRCMCYKNDGSSRCPKLVISGSDFCSEHQNCMGTYRKYTSGYEPSYNPADWSHPYIEGSHNCYSYFLDDRDDAIKDKCNELCLRNYKRGCPKKISECGDLKPQPGDYHTLLMNGTLDNKTYNYQCPIMEKRIMSDNPSITKANFSTKCPPHFYKGAMVVDPGHTFHFYRQNPDGTWSHKPGTLPVSKVDADKRPIYVPHFSNRDYNRYDENNDDDPIVYTDFCGYYCIPSSKYVVKNAV